MNDDFTSNRIIIPIILRSVLEAFVDFRNLQKDKAYTNFMTASFLKEKQKLTKEALNKNPYTSGFNNKIDMSGELIRIESELEELKNNNFSPINIFQKFEKVNMEKEYRTVYNELCLKTHNNIKALENRYIQIDKNENYDVIIFENISIEDQEVYIAFLIEKLIDAMETMIEFYKLNYSIDKLKNEFREYLT